MILIPEMCDLVLVGHICQSIMIIVITVCSVMVQNLGTLMALDSYKALLTCSSLSSVIV